MALDRDKVLGLHTQQLEAFQKAKKESKTGWLPPASADPYLCELVDVDAQVYEAKDGKPATLRVSPIFTIVGPHTDEGGKSLQGRKLKIDTFDRPETSWLMVRMFNRLFNGAAYPDHPGQAAVLAKDTLAGKGLVFNIHVEESGNPDYPLRSRIGDLAGTVKKSS